MSPATNHRTGVSTMTNLEYDADGINAVDLGVIEGFQYALDFMGRMACSIWRRKASEEGTYGGWRWECASGHPITYRNGTPTYEALSERITAAIAERRAS